MVLMMEMKVPAGVTISVSGKKVKATGPKGTVERDFTGSRFEIKHEGDSIRVEAERYEMENTIRAHILNMAKGVTEGFQRKMKIRYAHFPATVEIKGKDIIIKNFLGEKKNRKTKIQGNTKVEAKGQDVTVSGPDIEAVGQTVANIRKATKIRNHDCRVFQDGIYPVDE